MVMTNQKVVFETQGSGDDQELQNETTVSLMALSLSE